jgi:hypothetical protein
MQTEQSMTAVIPDKSCEHQACGCKIDADRRYCSDDCRGGEKDEHGKCACGHSDCVIEAELERNEQQ